MKQIFNNIYIKSYSFIHKIEFENFIKSMINKPHISLSNTFGQFYYVYVFHHSLELEIQFVVTFCSDYAEEDLLIFYNEIQKFYVLNTGSNLFSINNNLEIIDSIETISCLIGLFLTKKSDIIILSELDLYIINSTGKIQNSITFSDLVDKYEIIGDQISLKLVNGELYTLKI